ncbi:transporter permease [Natronosalvus vescus]|uniref:transporter permease n=1 Tax=Natronosalvus vescus TaxID=2953881 RepID=UPI0020915734|nr:transporter permease [Natronosalvus vescus]
MSNSEKDSGNGRRPAGQSNAGQERSFLDDVPWKRALLFGIGAFVVGMVLFTGLIFVEGAIGDDLSEDPSDETAEDDEPGVATLVGWLYFGGQFVDIEMSWALGTESMNLLDETSADLTIPTVVYYLVPVLVLIAAGYKLASQTLAEGSTPEEGAKIGATIAAGYMVAVVFATQIFTWSIQDGSTTGSVNVAFTEAILISGLMYPLLFGAIGGYLVFREN